MRTSLALVFLAQLLKRRELVVLEDVDFLLHYGLSFGYGVLRVYYVLLIDVFLLSSI